MNKTIYLLAIGYFLTAALTVSAQDKDVEAVKSILIRQQDDWNKGDIPAFMNGYIISDDLKFVGANGVIKGYDATLARYNRTYPDLDAMGKLRFEIIPAEKIQKKIIVLNGRFFLTRKDDAPQGVFTLIWKKIKGKWVILLDHTSAKCENPTS